MEKINMFTELSVEETYNVDGGIVPLIITGAMVINGLTALGTGVAVGYAVGKICKAVF